MIKNFKRGAVAVAAAGMIVGAAGAASAADTTYDTYGKISSYSCDTATGSATAFCTVKVKQSNGVIVSTSILRDYVRIARCAAWGVGPGKNNLEILRSKQVPVGVHWAYPHIGRLADSYPGDIVCTTQP